MSGIFAYGPLPKRSIKRMATVHKIPQHPCQPMITMYIHTAEIGFPLTQLDTKYIVDRLNQLRTLSERWSPGQISLFFSVPIDNKPNYLVAQSLFHLVPGIHKIMLCHYANNGSSIDYNIRFVVELDELLLGKHTVSLFSCNKINREALQSRWAEYIYKLFPEAFYGSPIVPITDCHQAKHIEQNGDYIYTADKTDVSIHNPRTIYALPYLGLATVYRIDFAANLHSFDCDEFLKLCKRTVFDKTKVLADRDSPDIIMYNKSRSFVMYSKYRKLQGDNYKQYDGLLHDAEFVIRTETSIRSPDKRWREQHLRITTVDDNILLYNTARGGLLSFLYSDLCAEVWFDEYNKRIGTADFYNRYYADKIIGAAKIKGDKKQRLKDLMELISQSLSVVNAYDRYIPGRQICRNGKTVQGSDVNFRERIRFLKSIGVQPLRIPDNWHRKHIENPINNVVQGGQTYKNSPWIPNIPGEYLHNYLYVKAMISDMFDARKAKNHWDLTSC